MTDAKLIIYGLTDPTSGEIRYVGQSSQGIGRALQHGMESFLKQSERTHKSRWIRKLQRAGLKYGVKVLEEVGSVDDLDIVECFWIAQLKGVGARLTNATKGGEGTRGYKHTEDWKRRASEAQKGEKGFWFGKKKSYEMRLKCSRSHGGRAVVDSNGVVYCSVAEAARQTGIDEDNLRRNVKSKTLSVGGGKGPGSCGRGLKFRYFDEAQVGAEPSSFAATAPLNQ